MPLLCLSRRSVPSICRASLEACKESIRYRNIAADATATKDLAVNKDGRSGGSTFWSVMSGEPSVSDVDSPIRILWDELKNQTTQIILNETKLTPMDAAIRSANFIHTHGDNLAYGFISANENEACQTTARGDNGAETFDDKGYKN
ncbi:hypothetical protein MPER_09312 [Moniliophthora perniciosa FA553]|nr:hypothetical protein MPER_09312 [Moniliophthora perniciosa FA553]